MTTPEILAARVSREIASVEQRKAFAAMRTKLLDEVLDTNAEIHALRRESHKLRSPWYARLARHSHNPNESGLVVLGEGENDRGIYFHIGKMAIREKVNYMPILNPIITKGIAIPLSPEEAPYFAQFEYRRHTGRLINDRLVRLEWEDTISAIGNNGIAMSSGMANDHQVANATAKIEAFGVERQALLAAAKDQSLNPLK
jgi:hypothetical protein